MSVLWYYSSICIERLRKPQKVWIISSLWTKIQTQKLPLNVEYHIRTYSTTSPSCFSWCVHITVECLLKSLHLSVCPSMHIKQLKNSWIDFNFFGGGRGGFFAKICLHIPVLVNISDNNITHFTRRPTSMSVCVCVCVCVPKWLSWESADYLGYHGYFGYCGYCGCLG
jgi:hypothetical protein